MKFLLSKPVKKVVVAEQSIDLTEITIVRVVDVYEQKIVRAFIKELREPLVLWEGAEYDAAGQWTDSDVEARVVALLGA